MSLKIIVLCSIALLSSSFAYADEVRSSKFDRIMPSQYFDMLRKAASAYGAEHYEKSFTLFQRTACAGDKQSQSALGRMYLLGQGTKRDDLTGYAWLKLAAEFIYPKYQSVVRKLEEGMTPEQRRIADAKVADLSGRYSLAATNMSCNLSASKGGHIMDQIKCSPKAEGRRVLLRKCDAQSPD